MSDLIDREELRKAMYHEAFEKDSRDARWDSGLWIRCKLFERVLDSMPSVTEQKKGKWINVVDSSRREFYRCSECGTYIEKVYFANNYMVNFCPNCGAKMKEGN